MNQNNSKLMVETLEELKKLLINSKLKKKRCSTNNKSFYNGINSGYYFISDTIKDQLLVYGFNIDEFNFNLNLDEELI